MNYRFYVSQVSCIFGNIQTFHQGSPEMEVREARGGAEAAEEAAPSTGQPGGFNGIKGVV